MPILCKLSKSPKGASKNWKLEKRVATTAEEKMELGVMLQQLNMQLSHFQSSAPQPAALAGAAPGSSGGAGGGSGGAGGSGGSQARGKAQPPTQQTASMRTARSSHSGGTDMSMA